jgi:hypothetical protein
LKEKEKKRSWSFFSKIYDIAGRRARIQIGGVFLSQKFLGLPLVSNTRCQPIKDGYLEDW